MPPEQHKSLRILQYPIIVLVLFTKLDFSEGFLELSFIELVNPDTFRPNHFLLNSASDGMGTNYNLTGGIASLSMTDVQTLYLLIIYWHFNEIILLLHQFLTPLLYCKQAPSVILVITCLLLLQH